MSRMPFAKILRFARKRRNPVCGGFVLWFKHNVFTEVSKHQRYKDGYLIHSDQILKKSLHYTKQTKKKTKQNKQDTTRQDDTTG